MNYPHPNPLPSDGRDVLCVGKCFFIGVIHKVAGGAGAKVEPCCLRLCSCAV